MASLEGNAEDLRFHFIAWAVNDDNGTTHLFIGRKNAEAFREKCEDRERQSIITKLTPQTVYVTLTKARLGALEEHELNGKKRKAAKTYNVIQSTGICDFLDKAELMELDEKELAKTRIAIPLEEWKSDGTLSAHEWDTGKSIYSRDERERMTTRVLNLLQEGDIEALVKEKPFKERVGRISYEVFQVKHD